MGREINAEAGNRLKLQDAVALSRADYRTWKLLPSDANAWHKWAVALARLTPWWRSLLRLATVALLSGQIASCVEKVGSSSSLARAGG